MSGNRSGRWLSGAIVLALLGACSSQKGLRENCIFNDDCESPLICAGATCRVQCRTDRDCTAGQLCVPSDNPRKRVCAAPAEPALCASDQGCPERASCAAATCWWTCRDDAYCGGLGAGVCLSPERLCAAPAPRS